MKQSKTLRRISVAIVAVLLITMSVLSVTLARYITTINGDYSGTAYSWSIKANDNTADFKVDLTGEAFPGMTEQKYTIAVKNEGEVAATLDATLTTGSENPANINIALDKEYNGVALAVGATVTVTITVNWAYGESVDDTADQGKAVTFKVALVAEQAKTNA